MTDRPVNHHTTNVTKRDTTDTADRTTMTDNTTERETQAGTSQKMKEMDHTPPVEGARRTFERGRDEDDEDEDGTVHE
jgi:hypothetical protein